METTPYPLRSSLQWTYMAFFAFLFRRSPVSAQCGIGLWGVFKPKMAVSIAFHILLLMGFSTIVVSQSLCICALDTLAPVITCPVNVTIQCTASTAPGITGFATATDNCDTTVTVASSDVVTAGSCPQEMTITRTWTATDDCLNSSTCVQTITVEDTLAPVITCPVNVTIDCPASPLFEAAMATDACDTMVQITFVNDTMRGSCQPEYFITRTWTATDDCGNVATCSATITVQDTLPPVITCPVDVTIECTAVTLPSATGVATASDSCDLIPLLTFSDVTTASLICIQEYTITRTWTATDNCGNNSICNQIIFVQDTTPPTFNPGCQLIFNFYTSQGSDCPAESTISLVEGQIVGESEGWTAGGNSILSLNGCLFDNCSNPDSLTARVDSIPITGDSCDRTFTVYFTILDECGNESVDQFVCVVNIHDNVPPVITCPENVTIECDESTSPDSTGIATAIDDCQLNVAVTFTDSIAPGACPQEYSLTRTWTADDSCGNTSTCVQSITVEDTTPPTFVPECQLVFDFFTSLGSDCPAESTISLVEGQIVGESEGWTVGGNSIPSLNGCLFGNCSNPDSLTARVDSISITGDSCERTFTVYFTILDECGNGSVDQFVCIVNIHDDIAPVITCPGDVSIDCEESTSPDSTGVASATDDCQLDVTITFTDSIAPGACPQEYIITRTWTADDSCGNTSTCIQTITVFDDTAPIVICTADVTIQCASEVPAPNTEAVISSDNCGGAPTITHEGDLITNMTCVNRFTIIRTYRATDECGNSATCNQTITVFDSIPPNVNLGQAPDLGTTSSFALFTAAGAFNVVGATVVIGDVGTNVGAFNGFPPGIVVGQIHVADGVSAQAAIDVAVAYSYLSGITCGAVIGTTVGNNQVLTPNVYCLGAASTLNGSLILDGEGDPDALFIFKIDGALSTSTFSNVILINEASVCNVYWQINGAVALGDSSVFRGTIVAAGALSLNTGAMLEGRGLSTAGAISISANLVTLSTLCDSMPSSITCPADVTVSCASEVPPANTGVSTTTDNCGETVTITSEDIVTNMTCANRFTVTRTYSATDSCGNSATCTQTISVFDDTSPVITCPASLTIECTASTLPANTGTASATDNCDLSPTIDFLDITIASQFCPQEYTINRTWTASDTCGNTTNCVQVIDVQDNTPPVIVCPEDLTLECTDPLPTDTASATDNCSDTITINYSDLTCDNPISGFTGPYASGNWTVIVPPQGGSVTMMGDEEVMLVGPDGGICSNASTQFRIVIPSTGQLIFDWQYSTNDVDGPLFDPFGYNLNGTFFQLSDNSGPDTQSGTVSVAVTAGDVFAFEQRSVDCILGEGATTVVQFYACIEQGAEVCTRLVVRTHVAIDECGNEASCIQTIFIEDTTPPSIVCPSDITINNTEDTSPENTGVPTVTDNCASTPIVTFEDITINGLCQVDYTIQRTWMASDECGNSSTCLQVIEVIDTLEVFFGEPIACLDHVNLSIDNECGTVVGSGMILVGEQAGDNNYIVYVIDMNGDTVPNATLTWMHVGQTFMVSVVNECSGQSCMGFLTVEDKLPPVINCVCPVDNEDPNCNITCRQIEQMIAGNIPAELRPDVIDNCGGTTLEIININVDFSNCGGGFIQVTWKATDASGNMSTCLQEFHIIPLTLETLTFPLDFEGICGGSSDPSVTGWPQVNGIDLNLAAGICNLYVTYKDLVIDLCGGGIKIIRTWTVIDWCTGQTSVFSQAIILADHQGPILTCVEDMLVGTDVWYCYANVIVPKPIAVDACSRVVSYKLFSPEGSVVTAGNNVVINGLPQGTHTVKWTVTDECGNSSTCTIEITVVDNVPPAVSCDQHTVVSLTSERPNGVTLIPAEVFNDGSIDNCGPVSFRARRMDSCIDFDWTTEGACIDEIPGGIPSVNGKDRGTDRGPCLPFACCDVGSGPIVVELEVTDAAGNVNYCMVEVEVQDKLGPSVECPPDIHVSCEFLFNIEEGTFKDAEGNNDGSLDEDPLSAIFGNVFDAFRHNPSERMSIIINDPDNTDFHQPFNWGIDGLATDNCEIDLQVSVSVINDCSGSSFPFKAPQGAIRLIERRFRVFDGVIAGTCLQRIWVIDYDPFFITDQTCNNENPNDGVIWPCDVLLTTCPDNLNGLGEPIIFDDACSMIGVNYEDTRFDFADSACYKVLREWQVIDWCQYNPNTGYGLWSYVQTIRVMDGIVPEFLNCPQGPLELCIDDPGIRIPANNQVFLGENNPNATSCSVHVTMSHRIHEACSETILYDVKVYPFNGTSFIQIKPTTSVTLDENHEVDISFDTEQSTIPSIQHNGLPYNSPLCGDYHRVLWSVEDGCGNRSFCDYLFRLEDCKDPTPVCIEGLSTVVMGPEGEVTIWASDFNASSFDDCTPGDELLFSFSGTNYQPSFTYTCENVPEFGVELVVEIWVADGGTDQNCNGQIEWSERNKDFCTTTIVITDNEDFCGQQQSILSGEILTDHQDAVEKVIVNVSSPQQLFPSYTTSGDGKFVFATLPIGLDYTITPERNDDYKNGVSTLDLVRIQKHLLGKEIFTSPYQYIAADANNSRTISALDLVDLRKLILGVHTVLPYNDSWRFIDKKFVMADPTNPWLFDENLFIEQWQGQSTHNDFIAVKIGDVNNTVKANALQIEPREVRRVMNIKAETKEEAKLGQIIELKLTLPEIVSGFQWTLETDGLEYVGVNSGDIQIDDSNVGLLENGITTMSWNGDVLSDGIIKQEMSIIVRWRVTTPGKVRNRIRLTNLVTPIESYTPAGEILQVKLAYTDTEVSKDFALYQNKPNPWNGQTTIGFDLPEDAKGKLTLFDATGKVIKTIEGDYKAGYNTITLTEKDIPFSGVIYYRLESGEYSASKKMVLIR